MGVYLSRINCTNRQVSSTKMLDFCKKLDVFTFYINKSIIILGENYLSSFFGMLTSKVLQPLEE